MSITRLEYLFQRYLNNEVTIEESQELMQLLQLSAHDVAIKEMLDRVWSNLAIEHRLSESKASDIFSAILASDTSYGQNQFVPGPQRPVRRLFTVTKIAAAAAILLLIGSVGYYLFFKKSLPNIVQTTGNNRFKNDIPPGRNSAVLTLADGTQIKLDSTGNGNIAHQGNITIIKLDSQLTYTASSSGAQNLYNTISTSRGNQYQLVLPDGTRVWLNAESSVHFPIAFTGNERRVEVTGEVYFDVKHNSRMPFVVMVNGIEVHDLGTQFNINAYKNEPTIQTTLVEGKVSIMNGQSVKKQISVLKPGEQAEVNDKGDIKVQKDADVEAAIAWKNGQFIFQGNTIQSIMRQLERWYDIEVSYTGNVSKEEFVGTISRYGNISEVLKLLEKTGTVSFEINGRKVIVK